jgi:HSP20 family protein
MKTREEVWLQPDICMCHDDRDENLIAEVTLPGAKKRDVRVDIGDEGFCVEAKAENLRYDSCFPFLHRVDISKAKANYSDGLLKMTVPFDTKGLHKRRLEIR